MGAAEGEGVGYGGADAGCAALQISMSIQALNGCMKGGGGLGGSGTVIMMTFDRISRSEVLRAPPK